MKSSGDRVIGRSVDLKTDCSVKENCLLHIDGQDPTTETRRHGESCRSTDFPDHPITCDDPITRSHSAPAVFRRTMRILSATLREIFDESAYDRFLLRTQASRSVASYGAFTRERDMALQKKPRCC